MRAEIWEVDAATDLDECPGCSEGHFGQETETQDEREQFHMNNCRGWWYRLDHGEDIGPFETKDGAEDAAKEDAASAL